MFGTDNMCILTSVTMDSPMRKLMALTIAMKTSLRFPLRRYLGYKSTTAVMNPSTPTNCESIPINKIMKKNRKDQRGAQGIWLIAFGYAMNTRPGPDSATSWMGTPCSCGFQTLFDTNMSFFE